MSASVRQKPRIGVLLRGGDYTYQNELILGAHDECQLHGIDLYCFAGGLIAGRDPRNLVYDLCGPGDLDAVIIATGTMGNEDSAELTALFERFAGVPTCTIGAPRPGVHSLGVDNGAGVRELTHHLIRRHQRRRIAFITASNHEAQRRLDGYCQALTQAGIGVDSALIVTGDFTPESGAQAVATLFDRGPGCDAIVAGNDWMALGAQRALETRGLRIPEDVALIGFDDIEQARFVMPPLTTVRQPPRQLGMRAVRLLMDAQASGGKPVQLLVPTTVVIRQSCGCKGPRPNLDVDLPTPDEALWNVLGHSRDAWIAAVMSAAPISDAEVEDPELDLDFAPRLVDALLGDLQRGTEHQFVMAVEGVARETRQLCSVSEWHRTVCRLRSEAVTSLAGSARAWLRAETVFEQAHLAISSLAEQAQAERRLEKESLMRNLEQMSVSVRTALDLPSLRSAVSSHLGQLRIPSLYIATFPGHPGPDDCSMMLLGYDEERGVAPEANDRPFRTGELVPLDLRPPWRHSVMVEPLFFNEQPLGFCVIELGARDRSAFKTVPELISTALTAIRLTEAIAAEAARRQRAEQSRLLQELEIATRIQTAILPADIAVPGLEISTAMLPADEVGGDYFDILPCAGGCWIGIGDVAGHGLQSGLVMLMIQSIVAATTSAKPDASPSEAWTAVNAVLYENVRRRLRSDEHATLTLLRYRASGRLEFAGAHEELVLYRKSRGVCERLPTPGLWAAILPLPPGGDPPCSSCELEPGDLLVLYTDGLIEARNAEGGLFGIDRLCSCLLEVEHYSVDAIRDHILGRVRAWTTRQRDDVTLVVLRYQGTV